jgi:hypothetical protein
MDSRLRMNRLLTFSLLLLPALGCGKGSHYQTAPVSGRVTLNKQPLAHAEVIFSPVTKEGEKATAYSIGETDDAGNYQLQTIIDNRTVPGGLVGDNQVEINVNERNMEEKMVLDERGRPRRLLPAKYTSDTKLRCSVPSTGRTDANFDLKSGK